MRKRNKNFSSLYYTSACSSVTCLWQEINNILRLTLVCFCFGFFSPLCRTKTSCPHSPKLQSWTGVNYWPRKAKPSPPWSASCPLLPVHSGQRRETLILVRTGAPRPPSPFISHAAGWRPSFHTAPLCLFGSFWCRSCLQKDPNMATCRANNKI